MQNDTLSGCSPNLTMLLDPILDYLAEALGLGQWVTKARPGSVCIDNFVSFLHCRVTPIALALASALVTTGLYIADPIDCISSEEWVAGVIDNYCFVHSTFTIPKKWGENETLVAHPGVSSQTEDSPIVHHTYYQWVCYILILQAACFYIPHGIWKGLEGGKVRRLTSLVHENKEDGLKKLAKHFKSNLGKNQSYFWSLFGCEVLSLVGLVGQMFLTSMTNQMSYAEAFKVLGISDPLEREDYLAQLFPKVGKCTFYTIGASGSTQIHDSLCVLPFNVINEKIYLGVWLWMNILGVLSGIVVLCRLALLFFPKLRLVILKQSVKHSKITSFKVFRDKLNCIGDWMLLRNLGKNCDLLEFTNVVSHLKDELSQK